MILPLALTIALMSPTPASEGVIEPQTGSSESMTEEEAALLKAVNDGWAWNGVVFTAIHDVSPMGHMLLSDAEEQFYYLDTDGIELVLLGDEALARTEMAHPERLQMWSGGELVRAARERLGDPPYGHVFTLSPLNWIDGDYRPENMVILPLPEIVFMSGDLARQLNGLPDGAQVQIRVTD